MIVGWPRLIFKLWCIFWLQCWHIADYQLPFDAIADVVAGAVHVCIRLMTCCPHIKGYRCFFTQSVPLAHMMPADGCPQKQLSCLQTKLQANTGVIDIDAMQVNNGHLPPHVTPYCLVGAVLAALLPIGTYLMQAQGRSESSQSGRELIAPSKHCRISLQHGGMLL